MSYLSEYRTERRQDKWTAAQIEIARDKANANQRREDENAQEQQRIARDEASAKRRRADAEAKEQTRTARKYARKAAWARFRDRLPDHGMAALWATMIVLPISLAWQAQALFALTTLHIPAPFNHGFPASVELAAWLCAFEAHLRRRRGESAGLMPTYMWSLAGVAAVINGAHGLNDGGLAAALGLAAMSMLGIVLHSARQGLDAARVSGTAGVRLALWRRFRYPRLSLAATSLRAARDGLTAAQAWHEAWIDRFGVGPDASRRERRLSRRALRKDAANDREAVREGDVTVIDGKVQRGFARAVREHVDRERAAALAQAMEIQRGAQDALNAAALLFGPDAFAPAFGPQETSANQAAEQGVPPLSGRARELLPVLDEAIRKGVVPTNPSVKAITRWVRKDLREPLGVPVAQELRDRVRGLHAVPTDEADQAITESDDSKEAVA